jgi:hypothetical protein
VTEALITALLNFAPQPIRRAAFLSIYFPPYAVIPAKAGIFFRAGAANKTIPALTLRKPKLSKTANTRYAVPTYVTRVTLN